MRVRCRSTTDRTVGVAPPPTVFPLLGTIPLGDRSSGPHLLVAAAERVEQR